MMPISHARSIVSRYLRLHIVFPVGLFVGLVSVPAQASFWNSWFTSPPPDPPTPGGSRGPYFCAIAPYSGEMMVQGDRPQFIWQGVADRVEVRRDGEDDAIWESPMSDADQVSWHGVEFDEPLLNSVIYAIAPPDLTLEPEHAYELWVFRSPFAPEVVAFQTLSATQQDQIEEQVASFEDVSSLDDSEILERADYFAEQDLWSDFWNHIFRVQDPADALIDVLETELITICELDEEPSERE